VEFALVLPPLLTPVVGIVELGLGLRDQLSMSNAVTSAACIGIVMGTHLEADIRILDAVEAGLIGGVDIENVT
jgi:Flp pilus assembly protein TadG